jgi:hypothetical protein
MNPFLESKKLLQAIADETEKVNDDARQLVVGLSEAQLNWSPATGRWSMAQCFEHLAVAIETYQPFFTEAIARGRAKFQSSVPVVYRPSFMGRWLIGILSPDWRGKYPAPKIFRPSELRIIGAPERFLKQQEEFLRFVRSAEGLDYNRLRLRSPVTRLVRYSLADTFVMTVVHGQRHVQQARRVHDAPGFPGQ